MNMIRNIEIDGKQVPFKASAAIPRIYRMKFLRDIYKDLRALEKSVGDNSEEKSNLDMFSLEMFEKMADLELLSIGLINEMYAESRNDDCKYA